MKNGVFCSGLCNILRPRPQAILGMLQFLCLRQTFMHLYYKKCASSSKLTVLSKVLESQLGLCLSGLPLFTGFLFFLLLLPWGGTVGAFIEEGWEGRSFCEFYFGFGWIGIQGICQPSTQLYWNMMQTQLNLEYRRCWKYFLRRSWNI